MAGITEWPFRLLCRRQGADETVSEMISAMGFLQAPKDSISFTYLLAAHPEERTLIAQIFGREPDLMARAAKILSGMDRYSGIDINFGCPAQKVTSSGSGSALMKDLKLSGRILRAVRQATGKRLSIKMRIGWDAESVNAVQFARLCEDEGVDQICVHGRTREQQYAGKADWDTIAGVRQAVSVPVIANGDVFCASDALALLAHTGAGGIAVGRGALGNPWIFSQIKAALAGEAAVFPRSIEVLETALAHLDYMVAFKGEHWALIEMRKHFGWYLKGGKGASAARSAINACLDLAELKALLKGHFSSQPD